jgi:hypothetical protein
MTLGKELTLFVATQTGLVVGQSINWLFVGPYSPDRLAVILPAGGDPSRPDTMGNVGELPFGVNSRDLDPNDAHDLALQIHAVLKQCTGADLGDWFMHTCIGLTEPQPIGYDPKRRFEWSAQYLVHAHVKTEAPWLTPS